MELRNIWLRAEYGIYDDNFFITFHDNVNFISNYLSKRIRSYHIKTDGSYNLLCISLTIGESSSRIESVNALTVNLHFSLEDKKQYLQLKNEKERFELYLSLFEKGYRIAEKQKAIPTELLLSLHSDFRKNGYKNERLFKKKQIKEHGIKVELIHCMTSYDYQLMLFVYNLKNNLIGQGCIYKTLPDEILFDKNVRNLIIENQKLIIVDFLNHPQFVCSLDDLSRGIVKSVCVNENTKKYLPNEQNAEKFERLKWK